MLSNIPLPNEGSEKIQAILNSDKTIEEKATAIYDYDKFLCDMADRRRKRPELSVNIIRSMLEARNVEEVVSPYPHVKFF